MSPGFTWHGTATRLDAYFATARERRTELARKLDMADDLITLLGTV